MFPGMSFGQEGDEKPVRARTLVRCSVVDTRGSSRLSDLDFEYALGAEEDINFVHKGLDLPDGHSVHVHMAPFMTLKDQYGKDINTYNGFVTISHPTDPLPEGKAVHMMVVGRAEFSFFWEPLHLSITCSER